MSRHCYAYGSHVVNDGNRADRVLRFGSAAERAAWVRDGPAYHTAPGYREALLANDPRVRRARGCFEDA